MSFKDFNPSFEIFNLPVGPEFLLFKGLNLSFDLLQFFVPMENQLLGLLKSVICKVELLGHLNIIPL